MSRAASLAKSLPLFTSAKRKAIQTVCVRRFDDGRWVRAPGSFSASELSDRDAIRSRFGGGRYEILGHDGRVIVARTRVLVDGDPKPLRAETKRVDEPGPRAFASAEGQREALVFSLLDEGLDLVDIIDRTHIQARVVRAIFEEWRTPLATDEVLDSRRRQIVGRRQRAITREWSGAWVEPTKGQR